MPSTFPIRYVDFHTGRVLATCWHRMGHADAYEEIERHAEVIANRDGVDVDIIQCAVTPDGQIGSEERAGIRIRPR